MKLRRHQGFTLIELLIVIAIIGILASVVLPALGTARDKGVDAKVKSGLRGTVSAAAIYYNDNGSDFTDLCGDLSVSTMVTSAAESVATVPTLGGLGDYECKDSFTEWAVWVNLRAASTTAWCVDSTGEPTSIPVQDSSTADLYACP